MKKLKVNKKKIKNILIKALFIVFCVFALNVANQIFAYATDDPIQVVNNLSNFIFGLIRAVGMIILGFGIVQVGMSLKSWNCTSWNEPKITRSNTKSKWNNDSCWWSSNNICKRNFDIDYRWVNKIKYFENYFRRIF